MINFFLFLNCSVVLVRETIWKILICILMEVGILCTFLALKDFFFFIPATRLSGSSQ